MHLEIEGSRLPYPITANPLREGEGGGVIESFIGPLADPCAGGEVEGTARLTDRFSSHSLPEGTQHTHTHIHRDITGHSNHLYVLNDIQFTFKALLVH